VANLNALEQDCYRRLGYNTSSPDTATQTRIRAFINETQQELLSEPGMEALLWDTVTLASVSGTPDYALPPIVAKIRQIRETTNDRILYPMSLAEYRLRYPDPTQTTGTPAYYVDLGYDAVAVEPSDASELFVKSDSASDGATKTAFLEGYTTGGYYRAASVALNGTTAASVSSSITTWIAVTKFYIALTAGGTTTAAGNVTLLEDSGSGTELARIPIGQDYARYRRIALVPCPSAAITYSLDIERDVTDMAQATDEPVVPPRFHHLLGVGARMREYEKQDQERYGVAQREYMNGMRKLKFYVYSQAVGTPNLRGPQSRRVSQLGGWFPSGS
jgi:hypothetical protein